LVRVGGTEGRTSWYARSCSTTDFVLTQIQYSRSVNVDRGELLSKVTRTVPTFLAAAPKRERPFLSSTGPNFHIFPCRRGRAGIIRADFSPRKKRSLSYPARRFAIEEQLAPLSCEERRRLLNRVPSSLTRLTQQNPPTKSDVSRWLTEKGNP